MAYDNAPQGGTWGRSAKHGGQWNRRIGGSWSPRRGSALGVTWMAVAALAAGTLVPTPDTEPEIQLLDASWDSAAPLTVNNGLGIIEYSIATDDTNEAEATAVIQNADLEVSQATDEFSKVEYGENPYEGTTLEPYYAAPVVEQPSADDQALVDALEDAEAKLGTVETLITAGTIDTAAVDQANADLNQSLESAEALIEAAAADATVEQLTALEEADDALNGAVAAVTDVIDEDQTWISDLAGWTPNIRYAIDRRGPRRALSGDGIDIAIIDSGVTPVQGLDGADKMINGPDLSSDGQDPATSNIDLFGHGTHLAGIIAGNDGGAPVDGVPFFTGIAPDARLVNVKVANGDGETSIAQIVAGIEWVIANKQANGMNIRVITLAFGYDWDEPIPDPLAVAVEEAWNQGIVVVISGGNRGNDSAGLDHPAVNPYVIAVAGSDHGDPLLPSDDFIASWSSSGDGIRNPDFAAPGRSIVSLRAPGSHADLNYPESHVGDRFAVASGTSQAAAVTSGTIALLLEKDGSLTPDQIKAILMDSARNIEPGETLDGDGRLRLNRALFRLRTRGAGAEIQQAHGRPLLPPVGFGTTDPNLAGAGWAGGSWSGAGWAGGSWSGAGWAGGSWSGAGWA